MDVPLGVTFPRLFDVLDLEQRDAGRRRVELAAAVNAAMAKDPKSAVRKLAPERRRVLTNADVPPWLRIPGRSRGAHG